MKFAGLYTSRYVPVSRTLLMKLISVCEVRANHTPASSAGTSKFQSIPPSSPYLCLSHSLVFWKCPHSNCSFSVSFPEWTRDCAITYKSSSSTQWAGMHALQNTMSLLVNLGTSSLRGFSPSQENYPTSSLLGNDVDDSLGELLPPLFCMAVCFMSSYGQARVQK